MAGTKTSALAALTTVADGDILPIVDVSDTTQAPTGSTKKATALNVANYMASVIAEKYDVRRSGVVLGSAADQAAGLEAAAAVVAATPGGVARLPSGAYRLDTTLDLSQASVVFHGDDAAGVVFSYYGSGTAIDIRSDGGTAIHNVTVNDVGTGTIGIAVGANQSYTGFQYQVRNVRISGFSTYGLHVANCEQSIFEHIYVNACGIGIRTDSSRHGSLSSGVDNQFTECRVSNCTSFGWDVDRQIAARFVDCQALSNVTTQFFLRGVTDLCEIIGLDTENPASASTTGLSVSGNNHTISFYGFSLATGISLSAATGCLILPSRFSTVTQPLSIGSTCLDNTIVDTGNLGSVGSTGNVHPSSRTYWAGRGGAVTNAQTGTTYTLVMADINKVVTLSNAAAITLTVPPNSTTAYPTGTQIDLAQLGAGQVTITPGAGVTINGTPGLKTSAQYGRVKLLKTATDTWLASGNLAA